MYIKDRAVTFAISIHAPHEGERHAETDAVLRLMDISIHAPHEGERHFACRCILQHRHISIHAPHEGERLLAVKFFGVFRLYFNPRSPRGGATLMVRLALRAPTISIHAPHEGERLYSTVYGLHPLIFQSTLPTRGSDALLSATQIARLPFQSTLPTRGSDCLPVALKHLVFNISIHAPHEGERRGHTATIDLFGTFQSTLPTRGSDGTLMLALLYYTDFNPRSPRGGAT